MLSCSVKKHNKAKNTEGSISQEIDPFFVLQNAYFISGVATKISKVVVFISGVATKTAAHVRETFKVSLTLCLCVRLFTNCEKYLMYYKQIVAKGENKNVVAFFTS